VQTPHALLFQHTSDFTCVAADDFAGAKLATQHLLGLGHRRIAYLLSSDHDPISRQRLAGYRSALKKARVLRKGTVKFLSQKQRDQSYRATGEMTMRQWLGEDWKDFDCTAILAHNDETAIGVIKALREYGLRVPQDVSVVGFDGTELSELSTPALTTVRVPLWEIGAVAVKTLALQMKQDIPLEVQKIVLPVQLKIGASTAPIAIRGQAKVSLHK
jgi:LacI family transcriptional regulator